MPNRKLHFTYALLLSEEIVVVEYTQISDQIMICVLFKYLEESFK